MTDDATVLRTMFALAAAMPMISLLRFSLVDRSAERDREPPHPATGRQAEAKRRTPPPSSRRPFPRGSPD